MSDTMEDMMKEIIEKLNKMDKKMDNYQEQIRKITNENTELKNKVTQMEQKIGIQDKRIQQLEKESKRKNLVVYGIEETENETCEIRNNKIKQILDKIKVKINMEVDIIQIRRIGKKETDNNRNRPLWLELSREDKKIEIIRAAKNLKGTKIWISEDLPKAIQDKRKALIPYLKSAREKGCRASIIYDKLRVEWSIIEKKKQKQMQTRKKEERLASGHPAWKTMKI